MSVDEVATLRAAGLESAAKVIEAARAGQVAAEPPAPAETPAAPEIPAAPLVPAPVAEAVQQQGPQPPPGKAPLTVADLSTITRDEVVARMGEVEWLERQEQGRTGS